MSPGSFESVVEQAALAWPRGIGWAVAHGPEIAYGRPGPSGATRGTATRCWRAGSGARWSG